MTRARNLLSALAIVGYLSMAGAWAIWDVEPPRVIGVIALLVAAMYCHQQWEERRDDRRSAERCDDPKCMGCSNPGCINHVLGGPR